MNTNKPGETVPGSDSEDQIRIDCAERGEDANVAPIQRGGIMEIWRSVRLILLGAMAGSFATFTAGFYLKGAPSLQDKDAAVKIILEQKVKSLPEDEAKAVRERAIECHQKGFEVYSEYGLVDRITAEAHVAMFRAHVECITRLLENLREEESAREQRASE